VGVGASRVRDLFEQGRRSAPCIIFIDELDAVGRTRGAGYGGGHDEREQTLNQLLVEMDGFDAKDGVIILAATNRPDVLDPALLRPGRFDRQVVVAMPDIKEREDILKIHAAKIPISKETDLFRIARATPGMSGADIANLVNEAALFAARRDKTHVEMADFEEARDKILMGVARKTLVISEKERRMTAIHEAGHALLHYYLDHADPLHKVTIVPHGRALGMAVSLPEEDSYSRTRGWILDRIAICYGGWTAEKIFYDETTTGTKQDLEQATEMARRMVCEWGMAEEMGPVTYGQEDQPIFLGKEIARHKDYSEETAQRIDRAIKRILEDAQKQTDEILKSHKNELETLSEALLARETLVDDEVRSLLGFPPRENVSPLTDTPAPSEITSSEPTSPVTSSAEEGSSTEA
jgi:cell division protease FtsH